jgi:hypothetical protein
VLASFYALGAKRSGFLAHRAVIGEADFDRERLAAAGLDVETLEASGQLTVAEFDPQVALDDYTRPWQEVLERSLQGGYSALWYARFATGPNDDDYSTVLPFERAWGECFAGQPVVSLCPYIVGSLDGAQTLERLRTVSRMHEGVLLAGDDGFDLVRPALSES